MSLRAVIILLALPLFLLLAGINGLLLYDEETKDMEAGMRGEAMAVAVTVAEFARQTPDPFADLSRPERRSALGDAAAKIPGLKALYLTRPGGATLNLLGVAATGRLPQAVPPRVRIMTGRTDRLGNPMITALAPSGRGTMVVTDIDAAPLERRSFHLKRLVTALIAGSAALAVLLGLFVARRVRGEFRRVEALIRSRTSSGDTRFSIREVRDLADAIGLIDKSVEHEFARLGAQASAGLADGIAALREQHFTDMSGCHDGIAVAIRSLAGAPAGSVYIAQPCDGGWNLAIGEADGPPADAIAAAIAARDYMLAGPATAFADRLDLARRGFGINWRVAVVGAGAGVYHLAADAEQIAAYAARNPGLDVDALSRDIAMLFPDAAIVAAIGPA